MGATIHDLPPELTHATLRYLSPSQPSAQTPPSLNRGATPPSAFAQVATYGPFAFTSRQLYETTAPFLYSSPTINAIVDNISTGRWDATPHVYRGIRDVALQKQGRGLEELVTARDRSRSECSSVKLKEEEDGVLNKTHKSMFNYTKNVTLVFANQPTTRPRLFRTPHCQACAMSSEEIRIASILAKADFEAYVATTPAARAALSDLVCILGRLDGVESFQALKRRNREIHRAGVGMRSGTVGMPSFVWGNNLNIEHAKVKGLLGGTGVDGERRCWGELKGAFEGAGASMDAAAPRAETNMTLEVMEDVPGGMLAMLNEVKGSLSRVKVARHSIEHLELSIEELPKMLTLEPTVLTSIPPLPLLRRICVSFKTDLRRPRVWKRLSVLIQSLLHSAPNIDELSLEMIQPGRPSWHSAHCDKTLNLVGELDECMGDMVAQHDGLKEVTVTVKHDCSSTDGCEGRVAQGDWFKRAKVGGKEVAIVLEGRS